jgi:hypothetical protein
MRTNSFSSQFRTANKIQLAHQTPQELFGHLNIASLGGASMDYSQVGPMEVTSTVSTLLQIKLSLWPATTMVLSSCSETHAEKALFPSV